MPARPISRPNLPPRVGGRPVRPPIAAHREHHPPPPSSTVPILIGVIFVTGLAVLLGVIWMFGDTHMFVTRGLEAPETVDPNAPTRIYRDTRDGRVMVFDADANGTRLVGTMDKADVPMAGNMYRDPRQRGFETPSASDRMNALGSAFK